MQLGWGTSKFRGDCADGRGAGDDATSWAVDGFRRQCLPPGGARWHPDAQAWQAGDVIGCAADVTGRELFFSRDGEWRGAPTFRCCSGVCHNSQTRLYKKHSCQQLVRPVCCGTD